MSADQIAKIRAESDKCARELGYRDDYVIEASNTIEQAILSALRAVSGQPVAYLKEWKNGQGEDRERVDQQEECERWLQIMEPKVTPLFSLPLTVQEK